MKRGINMINLKNKEFVKDNLPKNYGSYFKYYNRLLEILNESGNLIKKYDDYYTDVNREIIYKILL